MHRAIMRGIGINDLSARYRILLALLLTGVATLLVTGTVLASSRQAEDVQQAPSISPQEVGEPRQIGEELVDYYMTVLVQGDREAHDALLSDSVIIQRADGTYVTKDEALDTLYEVTEFQITNVTARLHEEVLVVRWDMAVEMSIDGAPYSSEEAPRIAAFVWSDDRWQIVAYGNFNVPTIPPDHVESPEEIGEQLANEFFTLLAEQDREGLDAFLSEAFIIQRADGSTYTKQDYLENIPQSGEFEISNVTARLHDATLVVRWDIAVIDSIIDGVPYSRGEAPRLATFVWSDGRWQLIGYGNFNVPAE